MIKWDLWFLTWYIDFSDEDLDKVDQNLLAIKRKLLQGNEFGLGTSKQETALSERTLFSHHPTFTERILERAVARMRTRRVECRDRLAGQLCFHPCCGLFPSRLVQAS